MSESKVSNSEKIMQAFESVISQLSRLTSIVEAQQVSIDKLKILGNENVESWEISVRTTDMMADALEVQHTQVEELNERVLSLKRKIDMSYEPDYAVPPGETLKELMEERGMSVEDLSAQTGMEEELIKLILTGDAYITGDRALLISNATDTDLNFWINREAVYRQNLARIDNEGVE